MQASISIPEGYEDFHTGRYEMETLEEKYAMEEIMSNPAQGKVEILELGDTRLPPPQKWQKCTYTHRSLNGTKITIHYDLNSETGEVMDFKFK